jgi:hypothetical protein
MRLDKSIIDAIEAGRITYDQVVEAAERLALQVAAADAIAQGFDRACVDFAIAVAGDGRGRASGRELGAGMVINLSEAASNVALDAIAGLLGGGGIELLDDAGAVLVTLQLSQPAAQGANGGELVFDKIFEGDAVQAGRATTARIVGANGAEVLACDVGGEGSDAVIRLTTAQITRGARKVKKKQIGRRRGGAIRSS